MLDGESVEPGEWQMWTLSTGRHVLTVTATDVAGNTSSRSVVFTVRATGATLKKVATALAAEGDIGPELAHKLLQLDRDARKAERRGDRGEAGKHLEAIRTLVRSKVDGELRQVLLDLVRERMARR